MTTIPETDETNTETAKRFLKEASEWREEKSFLQRIHGDLSRGQQRAKRKRNMRPSERAMMLAEYQRDLECIIRIRDKHYA